MLDVPSSSAIIPLGSPAAIFNTEVELRWKHVFFLALLVLYLNNLWLIPAQISLAGTRHTFEQPFSSELEARVV